MASTTIKNNGTVSNYSPSGITLTSGTVGIVGSLTLDPGLYVFQMVWNFQNNSSGYRRMYVSTSSTGSGDIGLMGQCRCAPANGQSTVVNFPMILLVENTTTYYFCADQNSGSSLGLTLRVRYIKY